jgi:hypothetical protein
MLGALRPHEVVPRSYGVLFCEHGKEAWSRGHSASVPKDMNMKKAVIALLVTLGLASPALAGHNPTPPEGYKNFGQCRSALAREQNDVRKNSEEYTDEQADDINSATCEEQANGSFRIVFD